MDKKIWIKSFLGITGIAIVMELIAAFDKNEDTIPWTLLIVENIPPIIGLPIIFSFVIWLIIHFFNAYKKNKKLQ